MTSHDDALPALPHPTIGMASPTDHGRWDHYYTAEQMRAYARAALAARAEPVWAADGWRQECDDADAVLRLIGLDPERCRTEGGWLNVPKIRTMLRDRALVYLCPAGCGCTWRDNGDGSMSLYGPSSRSCAACETMPLSKLVPVYATPPATSAEPVTVSTSDEPKSDVLSVERDANDDAPPALPPEALDALDACEFAGKAAINGGPGRIDKARAALRPWLRGGKL